jgi:dipeptidyl aminopeptidase/acylaminoacyl peptidase
MPPIYWTPDDRILFVADSRGESFICSAWVDGEGTDRITPGAEQIVTWSSHGGLAVTASNTPDSVGEIHRTDLATRSRAKLTHLNDDYFVNHPAATSQTLPVVARDGTEIDCRIWLPPDFDASRKYPLLLDVHGGPHSVFYNAFYPIHQLGATNGYVVLAPNPRGSSTYGADFALAVHSDWGGIDYLDVMAALREAVKLPYVDRNRVVIHGSSYGGYMASWAVGHTNRFKAAVIAAPVTDLPSFYGTSDIGVTFSDTQFGGPRRQAMAWYLRHSPLTYAAKVTTPVLLLHGEDDSRVPISQSEQYFAALATAGVEVEFVRLPGTSHGIFRAKHPEVRREYFSRMLAWFEKHLREPTLKIRMPRSDPRLN